LFDAGKEHGIHTDGCGEWPGTVERLDAQVLPHMGWNTVGMHKESELFAGLDDDTRFYFVHSYGARRWELETEITTPPLVTWSRSEEHTSELQSRFDLVCRLLLEKKKQAARHGNTDTGRAPTPE